MAVRIFTDINILIDLLDDERANHLAAANLFTEAENQNIQLFVTESVLNTTAYLIRKDFPVSRMKALFHHLLSFVEVIPVNNFIYTTGIQMATNDVEDAILYASALFKKLDYFVTNDIKDFKKMEVPALPVVQAKEVLELI